MSEFLVKMDTPNRCCDCPMCYDYILCRLAGKEFGEIECVEIVANWCPLIKIPPHGRLIDADAVIDLVMQYCPDDDGVCSKAGADLRELLDEIENLQTIIPASEEGE